MKTSLITPAVFALTSVLLLWQWLQPYPMPVSQSAVPPELPVIAQNNKPNVLAVLLSNNMWDKARGRLAEEGGPVVGEGGAQPSAADSVAKDRVWKLVGVYGEAGDRFAVISVEHQVNSYTPGEELPDGARLDEITSYGIQVTKLGKQKSVYLFGKKQAD